jgi:two-component system, probable response regulator PhcQ
MDSYYDYHKFAILYVDDEEIALRQFAGAFRDEFRILTASNAREGLKIAEQHRGDIGLLLTDQRMPGETGVWLLEHVRQLQPTIVRILVTAYTDYDAAIAAVNTGAIYKYVSKPWDMPQLETTLKRGLEFFMVQRERDELLREKMSVLYNMMVADRIVSLGLLATGLAHHIRNSLQAVRTFVDLAPIRMEEEKMDLGGLRNPDFWKEYYQNVQTQISRINGLLSDLCSASQKPEFQFADHIHLREFVGDVVADLQADLDRKKLVVENLIPESLPMIFVDKPKFRRLFELMLKDELVALPEGAKVELSAASVSGNGTGRSEIQIKLKDNGPALPKEALRLVFDPFLLRSDTPTEYGIHLMGCFFIVHHHGGHIEAQSDDENGTTFTITLPINPNKVPPPPTQADFAQKVMLNQSLWEKLISSE